MQVRIALLGVAHVHAGGYVRQTSKSFEFVGFWEGAPDLAAKFAQDHKLSQFESVDAALMASDAAIVCSETSLHLEILEAIAAAGKPVLCEKPILAFDNEAPALRRLVAEHGLRLMTAFPCAYAPAWTRVVQRVQAGEIGAVLAISATNHGRNPGGWFNDPSKSGGGALADHVVHVADLLKRLLGAQPTKVSAACEGEPIELNAMVTMDYASGQFVTLDSSWSRSPSFRTWGDVTMQIVGDSGVIEFDLFAQSIGLTGGKSPNFRLSGFGSSLDSLMMEDFAQWVGGGSEPVATWEHGLAACEVAWAALRSKAEGGMSVPVASS